MCLEVTLIMGYIQDLWADHLPRILEVVVKLVPQPFVPRDIHNAQRSAVWHLAEALVLLCGARIYVTSESLHDTVPVLPSEIALPVVNGNHAI